MSYAEIRLSRLQVLCQAQVPLARVSLFPYEDEFVSVS